jgi:Gas vesicle synthesis protein GvpO
MAKIARTPKQQLADQKQEARQALAGLPFADKLIAFAEETAQPARGEIVPEGKLMTPLPIPAGRSRFSAMDAAEAARQIEALVGMKVDSVSAVNRTEAGWEVVVDVIELPRIPPSTDLIAAYHVTLDGEGNLESYSRGTRYTRGQTGEGL